MRPNLLAGTSHTALAAGLAAAPKAPANPAPAPAAHPFRAPVVPA